MKVNTIINNFTQFVNDADSDSEIIYNEEKHDKLPSFMKDTIRFLEEEMLDNPDFFQHILTRLAKEGFKSSFNKKESTYTIHTVKGKIILM